MQETVKLYYAKLANMGDLLNVLIIEKCFGYKVERHSFLTGEVCAIGSCLGQYTLHGSLPMRLRQRLNGIVRPKVSIWGTGFINYTDCEGKFFKRDMDFRAVRGELTRKNLERMTGKKLDIPTGDAGILADELLDERPEMVYDIGIVPHICDLSDPSCQILADSYPNSILINVKDDPLTVVRQIAQCRTVLSSSLHGLIVADSFGIPNRHLVFSDRPLGDGYKFDDYYSAYPVPHLVCDLRTDRAPTLDEIRADYAITPSMVETKKKLMRESFPLPRMSGGEKEHG